MRKKTGLVSLVSLLLFWSVLGLSNADAFELGPFGASCSLRNQTYVRVGDSTDRLMQCRTEFNLELSYDEISHVGIFVNLRPLGLFVIF